MLFAFAEVNVQFISSMHLTFFNEIQQLVHSLQNLLFIQKKINSVV